MSSRSNAPPKSQNSRDLGARIKQEARRLGFDLAGITSPDPPGHLEIYQRWLAAGYHAGMGYLATARARSRRADPRQILPEVRSILVVAVNYGPGMVAGDARVASYAYGEDYHHILPARLQRLVTWIEQAVGRPVPHRIYTDTGPLLERELAQRAGLGWIGKNTCLIHPKGGSYYLLAEVLLGLELPPDQPFESDRCGSCTRCIDACPTACILPNRTLDAKRCISYLTIEEKGAIPIELRAKVSQWVFGCDICQEVCPWNQRFARPSADPAWQPRSFLDPPTLADFLALRAGSWRAPLRNSPLERPRRRGLVRNAAIAAGNLRDPKHVPQLTHLLTADPEPIVRAHAAWALGEIGHGQQALSSALEAEGDDRVREEIRLALARRS